MPLLRKDLAGRVYIQMRQLTSEEFWKRYFESKLFHTNRASIRSSAAQHVVKADPIFDQYLVKDDDGEYGRVISYPHLMVFSRTGTQETS
jgi:hypothetical protein